MDIEDRKMLERDIEDREMDIEDKKLEQIHRFLFIKKQH